jgi:RNA polymerase sigma-70 factor (ECF subfamily)
MRSGQYGDTVREGQEAALPERSDELLVRAVQAGDADAFGLLYERHFAKIYAYIAFKLGSAVEAEDVTSQVFLRALEGLDGYRWRGVPFQAWLFRITRHLLVDNHRRSVRRPAVPLDSIAWEQLPADGHVADPQWVLQEQVTRQELAEAMTRLTDAQQQVVALRFVVGLPTAEVARIMGRTEGAVKALQHAALRALQRQQAGRRS